MGESYEPCVIDAEGNCTRWSHDHPHCVTCWKCDGYGCEEGCGRSRGGCEMAHAGPDSHKVCRGCGGTGVPSESASSKAPSDG